MVLSGRSTAEEVRAATDAVLGHLFSEEVAAYVRRGRRFARTPEKVLADGWVGLMRAFARCPDADATRALIADLEIEFWLRRRSPPSHRVEAERALLQKTFEARMKTCLADPKLHAELVEHWTALFEAYEAAVEEGLAKGS